MTGPLRGGAHGPFIAAGLLNCWLWMQIVHEWGHALGGWLSGASGVRILLHPLEFSRTDLEQNPHPLFVVWCGPVLGILIPLLLWGLARIFCVQIAAILRFFAGFCLLANGAYLAFGGPQGVGDAGDLIRLGIPLEVLFAFGAVTIPIGLGLWNGQGRHFEIGPGARPIAWADASWQVALCVMTVVIELALIGH